MRSQLALALGIALAIAGPAQAVVTINEIRTDQPSADNQEYFELTGTPGESLNTMTLIVIGDGTGVSGVIEATISLAAQVIPADGYFLVAELSFATTPPTGWPGGTVDFSGGASALNFENGDNVTFMLVTAFTGAVGNDLDTNDDGVFNVTPWTTIIDSVAIFVDNASELMYSTTIVGPDGGFAPGHIYRDPDGTGSWQIGDFDGDPEFLDTPGTENVPEPATLGLLALAGLALARRSRA